MKYDRQPQKVPFQETEIPKQPLDIVHIDIHTINKQQHINTN